MPHPEKITQLISQLNNEQQNLITSDLFTAIAQGTVTAEQITQLHQNFQTEEKIRPFLELIQAMRETNELNEDNLNKFARQMLVEQVKDRTQPLHECRLGGFLISYEATWDGLGNGLSANVVSDETTLTEVVERIPRRLREHYREVIVPWLIENDSMIMQNHEINNTLSLGNAIANRLKSYVVTILAVSLFRENMSQVRKLEAKMKSDCGLDKVSSNRKIIADIMPEDFLTEYDIHDEMDCIARNERSATSKEVSNRFNDKINRFKYAYARLEKLQIRGLLELLNFTWNKQVDNTRQTLDIILFSLQMVSRDHRKMRATLLLKIPGFEEKFHQELEALKNSSENPANGTGILGRLRKYFSGAMVADGINKIVERMDFKQQETSIGHSYANVRESLNNKSVKFSEHTQVEEESTEEYREETFFSGPFEDWEEESPKWGYN